MGTLVFECPATGHRVSTGIEIDHTSFVCLPKEAVRVRCPHCSVFHELSRIKAWLAEGLSKGMPDSAASNGSTVAASRPGIHTLTVDAHRSKAILGGKD